MMARKSREVEGRRPVGNESQIQVSIFDTVADTIFPDYRLAIGVQEIFGR